LGIGDWGLGIGDWGLGPIPNPQSPIPNPQFNKSPKYYLTIYYINNNSFKFFNNYMIIHIKKKNKININEL